MTADDAESDMSLPGDWSVSFPLEEDENDTMKLENPDPQAYVCAFYKDLRIDSISLSSTCAVLDATVLKQYEISDEQR